jgi:acetyl-CoA carboxylase biotin carboxyl carrier protein
MYKLELLLERPATEGEPLRLCSPEVGTFTRALPRGAMLQPGAEAGVLESLGRAFALVVPDGASGRVASERPARVHEPVGYGTVLYELELVAAEGAAKGAAAPTSILSTSGVASSGAASAGLVFRAPYSGRFWHRPSPQDTAFVREGDVIRAGSTLGLLEVMKTFTHLAYAPGSALPERATVVRMLVADGAEVSEGTPLLELAPA